MNAQLQLVLSQLRMMWMYRWAMLAVAGVICSIGWTVVLALPNQYEVTAKVFIDTRSMLKPLLRGLVIGENVLQDTVALMRRQLLTRPNLEELARRTDLDLGARTPAEFDRLITDLANDIKIVTESKRDDSYQIRYVHSDPKLAKKLVDELLNIFLESAIGDTREDREVAQQFLDQQIAEYERRLTEAEDRLKEFKLRNVGLMPGEGRDFYARLSGAKEALAAVRLEAREAERRRDELKRQAASVDRVGEDDEPVFGLGGGAFGGSLGGPAAPPEVQALDARIQALQARLDELLLQYTDRHPDVVQIRGTLASLEEQKKTLLEEAARQAALAPELSMPTLPNENPVRQQIEIALSDAEATLVGLRTREEEYLQRVEALEAQVDTIPQIEAELQRLDRDYGVNRQQYDELVSRREAAKMSQEADRAADPVQIKVIEPPRMPITPVGPARLQLSSAVFAASLVLGAAIAFVMSQLSPRVFTRQELKELSGLPVIGGISLVRSQWHRSERRMELAVFSLGLVLLVAAYGGLITLHLMQFDLSQPIQRLLGGLL